MRFLMVLCAVGLGGGLGALLRFLSGKVLHGLLGFSEFLSVMLINITGCLLIGLCFFLIEVFFNTERESRLRSLPMNREAVERGVWPKKNPTQPVVRDFRQDLISELLAGFVITGVLGGMTTFSLFSLLSLQLRLGGHPVLLITNILGTLLLGLAATWVGLHLGRIWHRRCQ